MGRTPVAGLVEELVGRGVLGQVARVAVVADAVGAARGPLAHRVVGLVDVVHADHGREEVAPALAHAAGLAPAEAAAVGRAAREPGRQAVRVLVDDDAGLEVAVAVRLLPVPDCEREESAREGPGRHRERARRTVHAHARSLTVGRRGEVGVVLRFPKRLSVSTGAGGREEGRGRGEGTHVARAVLRVGLDRIAAVAAAAEAAHRKEEKDRGGEEEGAAREQGGRTKGEGRGGRGRGSAAALRGCENDKHKRERGTHLASWKLPASSSKP